MPEFYTRFRGRSDLMEYAKVRGARAATPCPRTPFPGGCLGQQREAEPDPMPGRGGVEPLSPLPPLLRGTCPLGSGPPQPPLLLPPLLCLLLRGQPGV